MGWRVDAGSVSMTVEDNGTGIPEELLPNVFDAYVTTKKRSGGMGIGLCISKRAVELHSGKLILANKAEGGVLATVQIACTR
jgi:signal transduction histidine kinase